MGACVYFLLLVSSFLALAKAQTNLHSNTNVAGNFIFVDPCEHCSIQAEGAIADFDSFRWFNQYEEKKVAKPYEKAGKRSCRDFAKAHRCFEECQKHQGEGVISKYSKVYTNLKRIRTKYCETYRINGKGCRMADTRICDKKYNKKMCGNKLKSYLSCIQSTLKKGGQSCAGICTPARRFHKVLNFQWKAECELKKAVEGICADYVPVYCFDQMKDTEVNWGRFEELNKDPETSDLVSFCPVMEQVSDCMLKSTTTTVDYFGFESAKPCSSITDKITDLTSQWNRIIRPMCKGRAKGTTKIQEICRLVPRSRLLTKTPAPTTAATTKPTSATPSATKLASSSTPAATNKAAESTFSANSASVASSNTGSPMLLSPVLTEEAMKQLERLKSARSRLSSQ